MKWIRFAAAALAPAAGLVIACGGHTSDGSTASAADACGQFYDQVFTGRCGNPVIPPGSETARVRARFVELCQDSLALPGSGMTPSQLEACTSAVLAMSCDSRLAAPECLVTGSLPDGTACNTGWQCQSGSCSFFSGGSADGGVQPNTGCGVCTALANVGQACEGTSCVQGAVCQSGTSGVPTCVAMTTGGAGAHCDDVVAVCGSPLRCDPGSHTCAPLGAAGARCQQSRDCASGLACVGKAGATTCGAPAVAGGACQSDDACASGLSCVQGQCATPTLAGAGQPCGGATRCLVGSCSFPSGTCPRVIADGQHCDQSDFTSTCDELSLCLNGVCTLEDSVACK